MEQHLKKLQAAVSLLESKAGIQAESASGGVPPSVSAYDTFVDHNVRAFSSACKALGDSFSSMGDLADQAFRGTRKALLAARQCKKPEDSELIAFIPETVEAIQKSASLPDNRSDAFNHQKAFVEFIQSAQWILITPAPQPFVTNALESADFYLNKILKESKDSPDKEKHRAFVKELKETLKTLETYIKQFHTTGLSWNQGGSSLSEFSEDASVPTKSLTSDDDVLRALTERIEAVAMSLGSGGEEVDGVHPSISQYDEFIKEFVDPFVTVCGKLGQEKLGQAVGLGYAELRFFIVAARDCPQPSDAVLADKAKPLASAIQQAMALPDNRSDAFNHQKSVAEFIQGLQWVLVAPAPGPFVQSALESADFYLNKVLTTNKDAANKADHREFVKLIKSSLKALQDYIKKFHTTGLAWNAKVCIFILQLTPIGRKRTRDVFCLRINFKSLQAKVVSGLHQWEYIFYIDWELWDLSIRWRGFVLFPVAKILDNLF